MSKYESNADVDEVIAKSREQGTINIVSIVMLPFVYIGVVMMATLYPFVLVLDMCRKAIINDFVEGGTHNRKETDE